MSFNKIKCQAIGFGKPVLSINFNKLGSTTLEQTDSIKYLGVTIQSDLKFDTQKKKAPSRKILGGIKHLVYNAPKEAKLLAYTSLCRPILQYADVVWALHTKTSINKVEMIQNQAISNLKGRVDTIDLIISIYQVYVSQSQLPGSGQAWTHWKREEIVTVLFVDKDQNEGEHNALAAAYDEINQNKQHTLTTRATTREINPIASNEEIFHQSFLPCRIRDMRGP